MEYANFNEEKKLWKEGYNFVIGLDEAGRGSLAGPVVAAAVRADPKFNIQRLKLKVRDSKKLSEKKREQIYQMLIEHPAIRWGTGVVWEKRIDKINILNATKLTMRKALDNLCQKNRSSDFFDRGSFLLIDGNFGLNNVNISQKAIIKGDEKVFSCAAAGIIAKVTRDKIMKNLHKKYPQYGFERHKGYGTKLHIINLRSFGPCKIHRKTFYPVSALVKEKIV